MADTDESKSIDKVIAKLEQGFPTVAHPQVKAIVEDRYHRFDGAPVRDYIAVLVQRDAKNVLRELTDTMPTMW